MWKSVYVHMCYDEKSEGFFLEHGVQAPIVCGLLDYK